MTAGSKIAGAAKGAAKALEGYSGIFHHLAGEHAEVAALMNKVEGTDDAGERRKYFPEIRRNLLAHARGEEEEFYPVLRKFPEMTGAVERSLAEHRDIEAHLQRLDAADPSGADWATMFRQLKHMVEQHVEHEEQTLFPRANDALESERAKEMQDRYEQVEEREKERL